MANEHADGSLIIDTKLDNEGFEKGSDKLLAAVKDLTNAVDTLGDNMMRSFSQVIPTLSSIAASAASANAAMANGALQASEASARAAIAEHQLAVVTEQAAQAARQQQQSMESVSVSVSDNQIKMSALEKEINSVSTSMNNLNTASEKGFSNGNSVLTFDNKLSAASLKIDEARRKLDAFGATKIPTEEYTWLNENVKKAESELNKLYERQQRMEDTGVKKNSKAWRSLAYDLSLAHQKVKDYEDEMTQMQAAGSAFKTGADTEEYKRMKEDLDKCTASLERNKALINSEAIAQARLNVQAAQEQVVRASNDRQRESAMAKLRTAQENLNSVAAKASNAGAPKESTISGWERFGNVIKSAGSAAVKVAGSIAKLTFKAVSAGIKTATNRLKQFISQSKKASMSANGLVKALTNIKTMLKSRVKRMFISAIITNIKESMQALAQVSSEFDAAMSNIRNRSRELASNITVTLGSLIQAIEPLLTKIIDGASKAISYLNALIASMRGRSTVTVAKKQMDSYAESTKDAADATKDLKNQAYGFDQLNKQSSDKSGSDADKAGMDKYEEVTIDSLVPNDVMQWFDNIKNAFLSGDWYGLGKIIAEGFNAVFTTVDTWINSSLRPKAVSWANNIAQVLNGIIDGIDWTQIGKTVASGVNTIFDTVNTFLTTFDFGALATGIGNAINGLFNNIDWTLLGQTFANKWNALIDFIFNLVSTIDWAKVGGSFSDLVDSFVKELDLAKLTEAAGNLINGLFDALGEFIDNTDWNALATKLGESINKLFTTVDFGKVVGTVVRGFNAIVRTLATLIATIDWYQIGTDLADALTSLIENIDWEALGELISNAALGLLNLVTSLITEIDWGKLIQDILTGLGTMIESIDWGTILAKLTIAIGMLVRQLPGIIVGLIGGLSNIIGSIFEAIGLDSVAGFFKGIGDSLANVGAWLKEHLVDPVVDGVRNLFGIHSPSTVFSEIGDFLIQGLLGGITDAWGSIVEFFSRALSGIQTLLSGAWDLISGTASTAWDSIKTTVSDKFEGLKTSISTIKDNIKTGISTAWGVIKTTSSQVWESVKSSVSGKFERLKTSVGTTAENIKTTISENWDSVKTTASTKWESIKKDVSTLWEGLKTNLGDTKWGEVGGKLVSGIKDGVSNTWETLASSAWTWGKDLCDNMADGINKAIDTVGNAVTGVAEKIKSLIGFSEPEDGPLSNFHTYMPDMIDLMVEGIKGNQNQVVSAVAGVASAMQSELDSTSPELTISENATVAGLDSVASRLSGIADTFKAITNALNSIGGFHMPQMAAGTIVPVKTKVDAGTVTPGTESITAMSNDVDERMADISFLLKQLIAIVKAMNLNIDMDSLTAMITQQQKSNLRNFGGV